MWILSKQLNITNRIRVNDTSGGNYFNLTTSTKNIEEAVESVFGKSASYLGAIAIESNTVKSYIEDKLYPKRTPVIKQHKSFYKRQTLCHFNTADKL